MATREEKIALIRQRMGQQGGATQGQSLSRQQKIDLIKSKAPQQPTLQGENEGEQTEQSIADYLKETAQGALTGVTDIITGGYAPELYEMTGAGTKEQYEQETQQMKEAAPTAHVAGQGVGGLIASSPLARGAGALIKGGGTLATVGRGALEAGALGGLQKADDVQQKIHNAAYGVAFGTGGALLGKGFQAMSGAMDDIANGLRLKGAGAMLKDFRSIMGRGQMNRMNAFIKKHKLVGTGSTVAKVKDKAQALQKQFGAELDDVYKKVMKNFDSDEFIEKLTPAQQEKYFEVGFYPSSSKDDAVEYVAKEIGLEVGAENAVGQVDKYFEQIIEKFGDDITIKQANQIKGAIDRTINYARNPQNPDPIKEKAFKSLRTFVNNKIKGQVDFIDEVVGGTDGKLLRRLNEDYGSSMTVLNMSADKVARETSNRLYGLGEQIAATGAGVGTFAVTKDPVTALLVGAGGMAASRLAKKMGPGAGARAADIVKGAATKAAKTTGGVAKAATGIAAKKATKGPDKWANAGLDAAIKASGNKDLELFRGTTNRATKDLLIRASSSKPGSKMFKSIIKKLEAKVGK